MSVSANTGPLSEACQACRMILPFVSTSAQAEPPVPPVPKATAYIATPPRMMPPDGVDAMALFDAMLISTDISGPRLLRNSPFASALYSEMQSVLLRLC